MQLTPVFLPGESRGQRSLVVYSPWDCKGLDMTEAIYTHTHIIQDKVMVDSVPIDYKPVIEEKCRIKG